MTIAVLWHLGLFGPPLAVAALASVDLDEERLRAGAVAGAAVSFVAAMLVIVIPRLSGVEIDWPWHGGAYLGSHLLRITDLSIALVPLPAGLWIVTVAATPRGRLDRMGLRRTALAAALGTFAFLTDSPVLLAACWIGSTLLFLRGQPPRARVRSIAGLYLWPSAVLLCAGIAISATANDRSIKEVGSWLIVVAVLIRKGIFPFHAWIPEAFESGRLGPVVNFGAPQLGTYIAAILVVPTASGAMLRTIATLSLLTAVYAAALALHQRDARRACGYLFVSQSALVLAGLDCTSPEALTGALILWISSAVAFTGLARAVLAQEARRGRLDLARHHGGFDETPLLATSFLVLGLACAGFPGTLGFVGQELLVDGAVRSFPALGFLTIGASALTGLAVLRMYYSLFCGSRRPERRLLRLKRREALIFGAVTTLLVAGGLAPRAIVRSRHRAAETILEHRRSAATISTQSESLPPGTGPFKQ